MWNIFLYVYLPSVHFLVGGICSPLLLIFQFNSGQSLSRVWLCDPMDFSMPGFFVHYQLPELAQTQVHQVSDAIQLSHPLLSPSPPAFNLSQHQGLFQWVSSMHQVAKVLEFQLHISPFNEYSGLIFFGMDWLYLLAVLGLFIFFFLLFTFLLLL